MSSTSPSSSSSSSSSSSGSLPIYAMAAATGMAVANIYYNQPMLGLVEHDMPGKLSALLPMVTQLGYALGLVLVVPLGDLVERRRLIVVQFLLLAGVLGLMAGSQGVWWLLACALGVGAAATVAQQIVPFAATLAPPERRGAVVGTVMSGLLCGILLSRTVSGAVSAHWGWRAMFGAALPISLLGAAMMALRLPHSRPAAHHLTYPRLLASMAHLWRHHGALRLGAISQAALFGSFSAFWSMLALHLQEPRFALGAGTAGLFGVIGIVGVAAAPLAGRVADRHGPRPMIVAGAVIALLAWLVFWLWNALAGLVLGVILLDFGVQIALISNQHVVYALEPHARARINTVFMAVMFLGGAAGSLAAALGWSHGGWGGVCLVGLVASFGAAVLQLGALFKR